MKPREHALYGKILASRRRVAAAPPPPPPSARLDVTKSRRREETGTGTVGAADLDESLDHAMLARYSTIKYPSPMVVGNDYVVELTISREKPLGASFPGTETEVGVLQLEPEGGRSLRIYLRAPEFKVKPEEWVTEVLEDRTVRKSFIVTPLSPGNKLLLFDFYHGEHLVGEVILKVEVKAFEFELDGIRMTEKAFRNLRNIGVIVSLLGAVAGALGGILGL